MHLLWANCGIWKLALITSRQVLKCTFLEIIFLCFWSKDVIEVIFGHIEAKKLRIHTATSSIVIRWENLKIYTNIINRYVSISLYFVISSTAILIDGKSYHKRPLLKATLRAKHTYKNVNWFSLCLPTTTIAHTNNSILELV